MNRNRTDRIDMVVTPAFTKLVAEIQAKVINAWGRNVTKTEAIELAVASCHAHLHSSHPMTLELYSDFCQRLHYNWGLLRGAESTWKLEDILPEPQEVQK